MKNKFNWRLLCAILIIFLWLPYTSYIFEPSITGGAYFHDFRRILLIVQEQNLYEIIFHIKPNAMTEKLKRKYRLSLCKKGRDDDDDDDDTFIKVSKL